MTRSDNRRVEKGADMRRTAMFAEAKVIRPTAEKNAAPIDRAASA